jgi:hypothetical protein
MIASIRLLAVLVLTLALLAGLPFRCEAQSPHPLKHGRWAQSHAVLRNLDGTTDFIDFCFGQGTFDAPISLDRDGRFDQEGYFGIYIPVPETPTFRVRYVGQVRSGTIALTIITLDEAHPLLRSYVLRNKAVRSHRPCPEDDEAAKDASGTSRPPPN